jgi:phospholipase/carboxylesterase
VLRVAADRFGALAPQEEVESGDLWPCRFAYVGNICVWTRHRPGANRGTLLAVVQPVQHARTSAPLRRLGLPLVLLAVGGLAIWLAMRWAEDSLDVHRVTPDRRGAPTLVLLHGYAAPGAGLVGLGETLAESLPGVQILVPEGPFNLVGSGRAWYVESPREAIESRTLLSKLIAGLIDEGTPRGQVVVAGFSQGGTMAVDISLFDPDVGCVGVLSGRPLSGVGWNRQLAEVEPPSAFIAHGRKDRTISLRDGKALAGMLEAGGASVTFHEHGGAHEITDEVEQALVAFVKRCVE